MGHRDAASKGATLAGFCYQGPTMTEAGDRDPDPRWPISTVEPASDPAGAAPPDHATAYQPPRAPPGQYAKKVHTQRVKIGDGVDPSDVEHAATFPVQDLATMDAPTVISRAKARERGRWVVITVALVGIALIAFAYAITLLAG